jgi:hypothetical protein
MATTYTLKVLIDQDLVVWLKGQGYNLCVAKYMQPMGSVADKVDVTWYGEDTFLESNPFHWEETYQVYASTFDVGSLVEANSNKEAIKPGQTCEFDGMQLKPATGPYDPTKPFYFKNVSTSNMAVSAGVDCRISFPGEPSTFMSVFVSPGLLPGATAELAPVKKVIATFGVQVTSTMVGFFTGPSFDVPYEGVTDHVIKLTGGIQHAHWVLVS